MKAKNGAKYRITMDFNEVYAPNRTINWKKGEIFTFDSAEYPEHGGCFVADEDGSMLSLAVINKMNTQAKMHFMEAVE